MAEDIDNSFVLNLVSNTNHRTPLPKKTQKDTKNLKGVKTQVSQHVVKTKQVNSGLDNSDSFTPPKSENRLNIGRGVKRKHEDRKSAQFVSSLFTFNPDIPDVQCHKVEKHVEPVFSTDSFSESNLHPYMISNIEKSFNIKVMTNVQRLTIPQMIAGRDLLVKSQTGSGKTLAYAVPVVQNLQAKTPKVKRSDGPYALIIVPTRELAIQSFDTFVKLVKPFTWIVPGYLMGGEKKKAEKSRIRKGINILVTTPGRFLDHVRTTASLDLSHVSWLIIDEADRLLDMGFEKEVSNIIRELNEKRKVDRQTVLVSATLTPGVERLAGMSLNDPVDVDVSSESQPKKKVKGSGEKKKELLDEKKASTNGEDKFSIPNQLKQQYVIVPSKLRLVTLAAFILWKCKFERKLCKVVVFLSTQVAVEFHHDVFTNCLHGNVDEHLASSSESIDVYKLHGDMEQKERTKEYSEFCEAASGVLLCTDVAARGLDMPQVSWIVQYNTVGGAADYIHRVGRTARAGSHGSSLLFLTPAEVKYLEVLNMHDISLQELAVNDILKTLLLLTSNKQNKKGGKNVQAEDQATALQLEMERYIMSTPSTQQLAKQAFQSFIRAYATFPSSMKHIFHVRHLHLGHVAKSFGLRDAPSHIGGVVIPKKKAKTRDGTDVRRSGGRAGRAGSKHVSEFGSGLNQPPQTKRAGSKKFKQKKIKIRPF